MGAHLVSNLDWYHNGPYGSYVEEYRLADERSPVTLMRVSQPAGDFSDPAMSDFVLCLMQGGPYTSLIDYGDGQRRRVQRDGLIELIPAHVANTIIVDQAHRFTSLTFSYAQAAAVTDSAQSQSGVEFGRLHAEGFRDPLVKRLILSMWDESADDNPHGQLFVESAMLTLIARLASLAGRAPAPSRPAPLAPSAVARIEERLMASLDNPPRLAALAADASMTESQFLRAFKAVTGLPPHQWVMTRRVQRACDLLRGTADPLADIAYACGFASQSHMTDVFRAKLGVTPGRYRREVGS